VRGTEHYLEILASIHHLVSG